MDLGSKVIDFLPCDRIHIFIHALSDFNDT